MSSQQLLLTWKEHNGALISVFKNLLKRNALVDCTLAADGQYLKAHKVVLCACSSYFELLFSQECEKNPIVILKDVKFQELEAAVNFMYSGEVEVCEDRLGAFMEVADSLQIKGLSSYGKTNDENVDPENRSKTSLLMQQRKKTSCKTSGDNLNKDSNHPLPVCKNINTERSSLLQQLCDDNPCSQTPVSSISTVPSTSSTIQQLSQGDQSNLGQYSSPVVPNVPSSESVSSEVNTVIKREPMYEMSIDDKFVEEEFVTSEIITKNEFQCSEQVINQTNDESTDAEDVNNAPDFGNPPKEITVEDSTSSYMADGLDAENSAVEGKGELSADFYDQSGYTPSPKHTCHLCGKMFGAAYLLRHHYRYSHNDRPPFSCDQCDRTLKNEENLIRHIRIHTGECPFLCDLCGEAFQNLSQRRRHRRVRHRGGLKDFMRWRGNVAKK